MNHAGNNVRSASDATEAIGRVSMAGCLERVVGSVRSVSGERNKMKKIALEGAINGCSDGTCNDWRNTVIERLKDRFTFHNPMDLDCRGREKEMEQALVDFDTAGIASSRIVLVMANTPSWGTAMAIQMAWAQHKYIVTVCDSDKPSPWLVNRSTVILKSLESAITHIKVLFS